MTYPYLIKILLGLNLSTVTNPFRSSLTQFSCGPDGGAFCFISSNRKEDKHEFITIVHEAIKRLSTDRFSVVHLPPSHHRYIQLAIAIFRIYIYIKLNGSCTVSAMIFMVIKIIFCTGRYDWFGYKSFNAIGCGD